MTTPERLRRRQRIEGAFLIFIGLGLIVSTLWFRHQDAVQRSCLFNVIAKQNDVLSTRGEIAMRDSKANAQESAATRALIVTVFSGGGKDSALEAFAQAQSQWTKVDAKRDAIEKARANNPYPDFPEGRCE
jgi:hypothetical protein